MHVTGSSCFSDINISQGNVATRLRCVGTFYSRFAIEIYCCRWTNFEKRSASAKLEAKV